MNRITPEEITELKDNEVFVFGSNTIGYHGAGAAKKALDWGAVMSIGFGFRGKTYAIPTKDSKLRSLPLDRIRVDMLIDFAKMYPNMIFLVTKIGCGYAGYTPEDIAPLFKDAIDVENIYLPIEFWQVLLKSTPKI